MLSTKLTQSGVDGRFRMIVPLYFEFADGRVINFGRVTMVGNTSQGGKISVKGLKDLPRRAMVHYYDDVLASN